MTVGDLDGDGDLDIAATNSGGSSVSVFRNNGSGSFTPASGSPFAVGVSPGGVVMGDFDEDGDRDLSTANFGSNTTSILINTGGSTKDFNGDDRSDIVWRNDAGGTAIWDMNDTTIVHANSLSTVPTNWTIAGTGDFNGDGMSDLLWRNDAGNTAIWDMDDGTILQANSLGNVPTNWHIEGTGDFNGDHMSDIVWRNDAGDTAIWDMNDGTIIHANSLGNVPTQLGYRRHRRFQRRRQERPVVAQRCRQYRDLAHE